MGQRSRKERRAKRKSDRAKNKLEKAEKLDQDSKKAKRLKKRAYKLEDTATKINNQIANQGIRGMVAKIVKINDLGSITIKASWNYLPPELQIYQELELSLASGSPFRIPNWKQLERTDISSGFFIFSETKNLRYRIKLFGVLNNEKTLLDSTFVEKFKL